MWTSCHHLKVACKCTSGYWQFASQTMLDQLSGCLKARHCLNHSSQHFKQHQLQFSVFIGDAGSLATKPGLPIPEEKRTHRKKGERSTKWATNKWRSMSIMRLFFGLTSTHTHTPFNLTVLDCPMAELSSNRIWVHCTSDCPPVSVSLPWF